MTIEDVNDTPPIFSNPRYSAVVPENSEIGTVVSKVMASDPDLGQSGEVTYLFPPGILFFIFRIKVYLHLKY